MRINYIELRNYRRFGHVRIELPDGVIGIVGSNGAGKSTLVESIAWALFGNQKDIVRAGKESIRKDGVSSGEPTVVKLEFVFSGDEYLITRQMKGRSLSIDAELIVNDKIIASGSDQVTEAVQKRFGMDYKSFFISVFAKQKDLAALSTLTDRERRQLVMRMLGLDRLDRVLEKTGQRARSDEGKIDILKASLLDENGSSRLESLEEKIKSINSEKENHERKISEIEKARVQLKKQEVSLAKDLDEAKNELNAGKEIIHKRRISENSLASRRQQVDGVLRRLSEAEKARSASKELGEMESRLGEAKKKLDGLIESKSRYEKALHLKKEQAIIRNEIASMESELAELKAKDQERGDIGKKLEETKIQLEASEETRTLLRQKDSEIKEKLKSLKKEAEKDGSHLDQIRELGPDSACPTCQRPLKEHRPKLIEKLEASIGDLKKEIAETIASLDRNSAGIEEIDKEVHSIKKRLEALLKKEKQSDAMQNSIENLMKNLKSANEKSARRRKEIEDVGIVEYDEAEMRSMKETVDGLADEKTGLTRLAAMADKVPELEREKSRLEKEIEDLQKAIADCSVDQSELSKLEERCSGIEKSMSKAREILESNYRELAQITGKKESLASDASSGQREVLRLTQEKSKLEALEEERSYMLKLQEMTKDFRNGLIARIIPALSQIASEFLAELTGGRYSTLTLDDGYNIFIEDSGQNRMLDRFSGGESDLANLCLRLAISKVIAERSLTEGINLLVLDEIFGSQDADRKRNLMVSFNALTKQFRQIVLISHVEDVKEQMGHIIEIFQDEKGDSHAKVVG